ncbi:hypothetical protein R6Q59_009818 [Mikania micrantha]
MGGRHQGSSNSQPGNQTESPAPSNSTEIHKIPIEVSRPDSTRSHKPLCTGSHATEDFVPQFRYPWNDEANSNGIDIVQSLSLDDSIHALNLPWRKRVRHVTWAFFTVTMATGGIANVLSAVPFRFTGLYEIGLVFFFLNIVLYIGIWIMLIFRFIYNPTAFHESLIHPTESLFVPAFAVSLGTLLITIVEYWADRAGQWLLDVVLGLFWFDSALAVILSITIYMILWSSTSFTIAQMTPIWIFPAYPLLIIGPHAANLSKKLESRSRAIEVIVGGFTIQGIGFLVSLTIYSAFVYRLMTQKLPTERLRPGMFVSVGPSAFTVSAVIGMAENLNKVIGDRTVFNDIPGLLVAQVLSLVGNWMSLWLWGLALWFFFVSLFSNIQCFQVKHRVPFAMTWFSFVFPQTALCTSTFAIARAFDLYALQVVGCVMTCLLIVVYFFVVTMMIRAIIRHDILWPDKGEDKDEGGFTRKRRRSRSWNLERGDTKTTDALTRSNTAD